MIGMRKSYLAFRFFLCASIGKIKNMSINKAFMWHCLETNQLQSLRQWINKQQKVVPGSPVLADPDRPPFLYAFCMGCTTSILKYLLWVANQENTLAWQQCGACVCHLMRTAQTKTLFHIMRYCTVNGLCPGFQNTLEDELWKSDTLHDCVYDSVDPETSCTCLRTLFGHDVCPFVCDLIYEKNTYIASWLREEQNTHFEDGGCDTCATGEENLDVDMDLNPQSAESDTDDVQKEATCSSLRDLLGYCEKTYPHAWKKVELPTEMVCPIQMTIMTDPVICTGGDYSAVSSNWTTLPRYERQALENWVKHSAQKECPVTRFLFSGWKTDWKRVDYIRRWLYEWLQQKQ
jgi:hypothetical protein